MFVLYGFIGLVGSSACFSWILLCIQHAFISKSAFHAFGELVLIIECKSARYVLRSVGSLQLWNASLHSMFVCLVFILRGECFEFFSLTICKFGMRHIRGCWKRNTSSWSFLGILLESVVSDTFTCTCAWNKWNMQFQFNLQMKQVNEHFVCVFANLHVSFCVGTANSVANSMLNCLKRAILKTVVSLYVPSSNNFPSSCHAHKCCFSLFTATRRLNTN